MQLSKYRLYNINASWLLILVSIVSHATIVAAPTLENIRRYTLEFTEDIRAPDGFLKEIILVNGQFPAPLLSGDLGDTLELNLVNKLTDKEISIHTHGVNQLGTPFFDGSAGISQRPIPAGMSMQLRFKLDHAGTFYYHAHYRHWEATVFGPIAVYDPQEDRHFERVLVLNDWWHHDPDTIFKGTTATPTEFFGDAKSVLTNGVSRFQPCVDAPETEGCTQVPDFHVINVEEGSTYRFRIINAGTYAYIGFAIAGHKLTIIEVDGIETVPYEVDTLEINTGQRFSVLVTANQPVADYWVNSEVLYSGEGVPRNGQAILRYDNGKCDVPVPTTPDATLPTLGANPTPGWIMGNLEMLKPDGFATGPADVQLRIVASETFVDQKVAVQLNNVSFVEPHDFTLLEHAYQGTLDQLPIESRPAANIPLNSVVDLVVINTANNIKRCEPHPYHLHGHSFYILGHGSGDFTEADRQNLNMVNPIKRDTESVFPFSGAVFQEELEPGTPCGWMVLRFVADNAGVWPFHCHISLHMMWGMMIALNVGDQTNLPLLPQSFPNFTPAA